MSDTYYSNNTQNIDLLEASRLAIMNDELRPIIAKKLALSDGIRVLDVGCGYVISKKKKSKATEA